MILSATPIITVSHVTGFKTIKTHSIKYNVRNYRTLHDSVKIGSSLHFSFNIS